MTFMYINTSYSSNNPFWKNISHFFLVIKCLFYSKENSNISLHCFKLNYLSPILDFNGYFSEGLKNLNTVEISKVNTIKYQINNSIFKGDIRRSKPKQFSLVLNLILANSLENTNFGLIQIRLASFDTHILVQNIIW